MAVIPWIERLRFTYFGNATAKRDLRSQLRGNQALLLWGGYLGVMIVMIAIAYNQALEPEMLSVSIVQARLHEFYNALMIMLSVVICVVTPAMTAGTIVVERQRQSLDLLFSGPIEPKYLLVGKMMSSFRYTWMLLVLSIPVTAVCVVMGGATWAEVLIAYILLSLSALVFTSIGLTISCITNTPAAAVIWTYLTVAGYLIFISSILAVFGAPVASTAFRTGNMPWFIGIVPFAVVQAAPSVGTVFGHEVPGWLLVVLYSLLVCKLMLVGAGSALSPARSKETLSLRIHGLVYTGVLMYLLSYTYCSALSAGSFSGSSMATYGDVHQASLALFRIMSMFFVILFPVLPNIVCYGPDGGFKFSNDGRFNLRKVFTTSPSGGLPYLLLLFVSMVIGICAGWIIALNSAPSSELLIGMLYVASYVFMLWAMGRGASSFSRTVKASRLLLFGMVIALVGVPLPVLGILEGVMQTHGELFRLFPLYPIFVENALNESAVYTVVFLLIATCFLVAEKNRSKELVPKSSLT